MDLIVRIEPVGERVLERSGIDTTRSSTSLENQTVSTNAQRVRKLPLRTRLR